MKNVEDYLEYDPDSGIVKWIKRPARRIKIGDEAGWITAKGYRRIKFDGIKKIYDTHYLVPRSWKVSTKKYDDRPY